MKPRYVLRLMFEWGGGCLWCGNEAARAKFDVGPVEDLLLLSPETHRRLDELSVWHDQALNWDYPPDPGPWSPEEYERFDQAANELLMAVKDELGPEYEVRYVRL
jgi:hypothetical protein